MGEVAAWIVDVVELEEEVYTRLIIHAESVSGTIPVMGYESRANHSRYIAPHSFLTRRDDLLFVIYFFSVYISYSSNVREFYKNKEEIILVD